MIARTEESMEHINLQGGWPTPRLHPSQELGTAAAGLFNEKDVNSHLRYGPELGSATFRDGVATWLTELYAPVSGAVSGERIIITNGASNGLSTILQKFADTSYTQGVWMVEPTYFLACPIFRDAGLSGKIFGVPEGQDGIDLDFLREQFENFDKNHPPSDPSKTASAGYPKVYRHIVYLIPTFSNPSGKTMSVETRHGLIKLARKHDALVVSDDVYDMLRWPTAEDVPRSTAFPCPPRLVDIDREMEGTLQWGNSVSNGSFSKIVAPGVRVGWLEGQPAFISAMGTVGATVSGGCQGHFGSLVVERLLASGSLSKHIHETLIPVYQKRWRTMVKAIKEFLYPLGVQIIEEQSDGFAGGFFLYLCFKNCSATGPAIANIALRDFNLRIASGEIFSVPDDPRSKQRGVDTYYHGARLCWAWNEEDVLVEGIHRLASAIKQAAAEAGN